MNLIASWLNKLITGVLINQANAILTQFKAELKPCCSTLASVFSMCGWTTH